MTEEQRAPDEETPADTGDQTTQINQPPQPLVDLDPPPPSQAPETITGWQPEAGRVNNLAYSYPQYDEDMNLVTEQAQPEPVAQGKDKNHWRTIGLLATAAGVLLLIVVAGLLITGPQRNARTTTAPTTTMTEEARQPQQTVTATYTENHTATETQTVVSTTKARPEPAQTSTVTQTVTQTVTEPGPAQTTTVTVTAAPAG